MALDLTQEREQAHAYLDQLPAPQLTAVRSLLESMVDPVTQPTARGIEEDDDELSAEDRQAIRSSRDYFRQNPEGGLSLEEIAAGCGFSMDQIRKTD